jgi:hypothetical protein
MGQWVSDQGRGLAGQTIWKVARTRVSASTRSYETSWTGYVTSEKGQRPVTVIATQRSRTIRRRARQPLGAPKREGFDYQGISIDAGGLGMLVLTREIGRVLPQIDRLATCRPEDAILRMVEVKRPAIPAQSIDIARLSEHAIGAQTSKPTCRQAIDFPYIKIGTKA